MELESPGQKKSLKLEILWLLVLFFNSAYCGGYSKKCPAEEIKVTTNPEVLKSYGFDDGNYKPNMECEWRMTAANTSLKIRVDVMYFDLEEMNDEWKCHDYLLIFDGYDDEYRKFPSMCGYIKSFSIVSSTSYLYFEFHSDDTINRKGFKIKYYAVPFSTRSFGPDFEDQKKHDFYYPSTTEHPKKYMNSKYIIIGSVFGGVCTMVVIIVVACLCLSNKRCQCCRNTRTVSSARPERRHRRRRTNRVEQTHSSSSGSFEGLGRHTPPHELYVISPLPPYSATPPSPPPYSPPYQETELTVFPSTHPEFAFFPCAQEFRQHRPLPASPPPSYSSQDLPPIFLNSLYDSHPPNTVYPSQHQCLYRTNT